MHYENESKHDSWVDRGVETFKESIEGGLILEEIHKALEEGAGVPYERIEELYAWWRHEFILSMEDEERQMNF